MPIRERGKSVHSSCGAGGFRADGRECGVEKQLTWPLVLEGSLDIVAVSVGWYVA